MINNKDENVSVTNLSWIITKCKFIQIGCILKKCVNCKLSFHHFTPGILLWHFDVYINSLVSNNGFDSVWFGMVLVGHSFINCLASESLLCPFHKKLRIWWKKSFGFCQTDNPRFSFIMYCYTYRQLTCKNLLVS